MLARTREVEHRVACLAVDANRDLHLSAIVHRIGKATVFQPIEQSPYALFGIGEHVGHVRGDHIRALLCRSLAEQFGPARTGGKLRPQIGDIAIGVARGMRRGRERLAHFRFAKTPFVDQ